MSSLDGEVATQRDRLTELLCGHGIGCRSKGLRHQLFHIQDANALIRDGVECYDPSEPGNGVDQETETYRDVMSQMDLTERLLERALFGLSPQWASTGSIGGLKGWQWAQDNRMVRGQSGDLASAIVAVLARAEDAPRNWDDDEEEEPVDCCDPAHEPGEPHVCCACHLNIDRKVE